MKLIALHGFLGRPNDWSTLFQGHVLSEMIASEDLYQAKVQKMPIWAKAFNAKFAVHEKKVLMGYSLGGRLALHALLDDPSAWQAAVIVSAHLGQETVEDKRGRQAMDEHWAKRFEKDPEISHEKSNWESIMQDWNLRDVFNGDAFHFDRRESDYSRQILADVLREWSLGKQEKLSEIEQLNIPILWVAGEKDILYKEQAMKIKLSHPKSVKWIAQEAGHRVPWESPQQFLEKITQFLTERNLVP